MKLLMYLSGLLAKNAARRKNAGHSITQLDFHQDAERPFIHYKHD